MAFSAPTAPAGTTTTAGLLGRVVVVSVTLAVTVYLVPLLVRFQMWTWLVVVLLSAASVATLYSTRRLVPGKYLFPGTFFLSVFLVVPAVLTVQTSFTNFGDGFRGTKEEAITSITNNSVVQTASSPVYNLSVATTGTVSEGPFVLFLVDPATGRVLHGGDGEAVREPSSEVTVTDGYVTSAPGYTILSPREVNDAYETVSALTLTVSDSSAVKVQGVRAAFEGTRRMVYDEAADTITDTSTNEVYSVERVGLSERFVNEDGRSLPQSWRQGVGLANYERLLTRSDLASQFLGAFLWTLTFALLSVLLTFVLGFALALALNDRRMRGQRLYRSLLLLPYAVPGFISLLVWSSFYNQDFGLINEVLHLDVPWLSNTTAARAAVLITNTWMGFPYMFIVCTGALQSIPSDLTEAARIDGASSLQITWRITTPLLLVAVAPLLVSTFAFNFNNFNAIELLTEGGPFAAGEYTRGGTDILISMVYRIAFGGSGADYGLASAVSVVLFVITGVLAAVQFRATRALEDIR
ncbi:ABC transporter permease subunit [Actinomyces wuliandei]|uniref:ABC transporter permease subunit n=1 Tax=Actinomyces wuliandei TaxID=2057743 RepID=UPI000FD8269E|nr:ABC transporter permease subunit [Actinomyces wuliandei]